MPTETLLQPTTWIAAFVAYIAWQQMYIAHNKWKYDLFERRLKIYDAAHLLLRNLRSGMNEKTDALIFNLHDEARYAKWLLDSNLETYLQDELCKQAIELHSIHKELEPLRGLDRTKNVDKQRELKKWFSDQEAVIDKKFSYYLKIQHWDPVRWVRTS